MRLAICVPDSSGVRWVEAFVRLQPDGDVTIWTPGAAPIASDFACVWAPPREFFEVHPPFKAVFNLGAGVDSILKLADLPSLLKGAPLIRLNDAGMAMQMAEYVTSFIARQVRGFDGYAAQQAETLWKKRAPVDKSAWPVGVMGMGSIGAVVARSISAKALWTRATRSSTSV